jgi:hypothetical protein
MRARLAGVLAAAGIGGLLGAGPGVAHHAIGGTVDTSKQVVSDMILTKVDWINPHIWFHFDVRRPNGTVQRDVMVEWMGLSGMRNAGYGSANVFDLGTNYKVTYYPNRDGSPGGHLVRMTDHEGTVFQRK